MSRRGWQAWWSARATLAVALVAAGPAGAQQIDTGTPPTNTIWPFGVIPAGTFPEGAVIYSDAQTFIAPAGATGLTQFRFWLRNNDQTPGSNFQNARFHAYVFAWSDATQRPTGPALYRSPLQSGTSSVVPTAYTFDVGGVVLTPGQRYAAVLSTLGTGLPAGGVRETGAISLSSGNTFPDPPRDLYPDGAGWTLITPVAANDPAALTASAWSLLPFAVPGGIDYAFTASFAVVPEPSTLALVAGGLAALGFGAARRRRQPAA